MIPSFRHFDGYLVSFADFSLFTIFLLHSLDSPEMSPERRKPPDSPSDSDLFTPRYSSAYYSPRRDRRRRLLSPDSTRDDVDSDYHGSSRSPRASGEDEYQNPASEDVRTRGGSRSISMQFPEPKAGGSKINSKAYSNSPRFPRAMPYVHVAPMPVFRGTDEECPVAHLSRFAKVCRANNADSPDTMSRIFPVTLEREAALWYDLNIEPYRSLLGWDDVKASFLQAYQKIELLDQLRSQLTTLNQGRDECVRSYFLRLQLILQRWPDHGLPDGLVKGIFVDGLSGELQEWIVPQRPESLDDVLRLAFEYEQVKGVKGLSVDGAGECGFCGGPHGENGCEVRERMRGLWLESKERKMRVGLVKESERGGGDHGEDVGRSVSIGSTSLRKSQCQCWKHQCSRKKLESSN
ncbi:14_3_3 domain-containing protein [Psidium guajava]|nr:14_3_3 domain-containing protein [Psidium guajava]